MVMSTPKKSIRKTAKRTLARRSPAREFTVVVEDMRSQFNVFGEALQGLAQQMSAGFAQVDARFAQVDARFAQVDARFDGVDREVNLVKGAVLEHGRELRDIRTTLTRIDTRVTRIEIALDTKVTRDEVESIVERAMARR
jgi:hypothetical protein